MRPDSGETAGPWPAVVPVVTADEADRRLRYATNLPGVFAVGDIAGYPHKLQLILSGFAEVAQAAHAAFAYVYPNEALHFEHSTSTGVPAPQAQ